jgi:thiosulfate/3-mercaptopyruvate sulfurtransferase
MEAQDFRANVLITAEALAQRVNRDKNIVVLAVRSTDSSAPKPYDLNDRIPGAVDTDLASEFSRVPQPGEGSRPLPHISDLEKHVRQWGIDRSSFVVLYDHDGNLQAARGWWVLRWAGLKNIRLLDGGFAAWQAAGLPVDRIQPKPRTSSITLSAGHLPVIDAPASAALARSGILLDTRIAPNYQGGVTDPGQPARGHIPGAINIPAADLLAADGTFADEKTLIEIFRRLGVDGSRSVGFYCGAGVSAPHGMAALATIGIEAALYPGSWSAWSSESSRPVARGSEPG